MAGGSLIGNLHKAFKELEQPGFLDGPANTKTFYAQAAGCNPITNTVKTASGQDPLPSATRTRSPRASPLATPPDGFFALAVDARDGRLGRRRRRRRDRRRHAAPGRDRGTFTETAGGVTLAVTKKLIEQGRIDCDGSTVICITGNGLKTQEALAGKIARPTGDSSRPWPSSKPSSATPPRPRPSWPPRRPDRLSQDPRTPRSSHDARRPNPHPAQSPHRRPRHRRCRRRDRRRSPRPCRHAVSLCAQGADLRRRGAAPVRHRLCEQRRHPLPRRLWPRPLPTRTR